jgi:hypothetical protein
MAIDIPSSEGKKMAKINPTFFSGSHLFLRERESK